MLENFNRDQLIGIYALVAQRYDLTATLDQALQDRQIIELLEYELSELTITPNVVKIPLDTEKTIVSPRSEKLANTIKERTTEKKGRRNTKTQKNKTVNCSVSENVTAINNQDHIRSENYLYVYDRRLSIEIMPNGNVNVIDKKLKVKITIGKFISYHPDYTFIVSNHNLSLNVLLTVQTFIGQLRDVTKYTSKNLEDLRYWLTFRDKTNPVTLALVENKQENDFSVWFASQNFTSLKNWIKRQAKKGIDTKNWYIQLDIQKLIDDQRIRDIWDTVNGYKTFKITHKLK